MNVAISIFSISCFFLHVSSSNSPEKSVFETGVRDKIVGGKIPLFGEYPFVVSIREKEIGRRICGGSIIAATFVMTACHCVGFEKNGEVIANLPDTYVIVAGLQFFPGATESDSIFSQWRNVSEVFVHPKCKRRQDVFGWDSDFAVLTATNKLMFSEHIKPFKVFALNKAALREGIDDIMYKGEECTLIGWGSSSIASSKYNADVLKAVQVTTIDYLQCQKELCSLQKMFCDFTHFYTRRICFQPDLNSSVCIGNGGGPLVCRGFVWGILNWSPSCGKPQTPIIFSKIEDHLEYYLKFIFAVSSSPATSHFTLASFVSIKLSFIIASVLINNDQ